jgi:hypothetical protein
MRQPWLAEEGWGAGQGAAKAQLYVAGVVTVVSDRLRKRIERDFPEPGSAPAVIELVGAVEETERVQAAVVLWARGDLARLRDARDLASQDWRDVLVRAGLADEDWRSRLDAELGPLD